MFTSCWLKMQPHYLWKMKRTIQLSGNALVYTCQDLAPAINWYSLTTLFSKCYGFAMTLTFNFIRGPNNTICACIQRRYFNWPFECAWTIDNFNANLFYTRASNLRKRSFINLAVILKIEGGVGFTSSITSFQNLTSMNKYPVEQWYFHITSLFEDCASVHILPF